MTVMKRNVSWEADMILRSKWTASCNTLGGDTTDILAERDSSIQGVCSDLQYEYDVAPASCHTISVAVKTARQSMKAV